MSRAIGLDEPVWNGMMLSDGGLEKSGPGRNARFKLTCKYEEFVKTFRQMNDGLPWTEPKCRLVYDKRTKKTYTSWNLRSLTDKRLTKEYDRWYPAGKKVVPKDLLLDQSTLVWWYLGDGSLYRKKSRPNYRRVVLSVQGFSDEDIEFLRSKLVDLLGDDAVYVENREIIIARRSLCKFVSIVGSTSPIECYQYKFEFGPYVDENYWPKSFVGSRNPIGRPKGAKDKGIRKRRSSLPMKETA